MVRETPDEEPKINRGLHKIEATKTNKTKEAIGGFQNFDVKEAEWFGVAKKYAALKELVARKLQDLETHDETTPEGKIELVQLNKSLDLLAAEEKSLEKTLGEQGLVPEIVEMQVRNLAGDDEIEQTIKEIESEKMI